MSTSILLQIQANIICCYLKKQVYSVLTWGDFPQRIIYNISGKKLLCPVNCGCFKFEKSISPENNWCSFLYFLVFSKTLLISLVYHTWSQVKLRTSPLWETTYFHLFECIEIETADKNIRDRSEEWVCYLVILSHIQCQQVTMQFPGWVPPSAWKWIISFSKWPKTTDQAQLGQNFRCTHGWWLPVNFRGVLASMIT